MSPVSGKKLTKSEKSSLASLRFVEFVRDYGVCLKRKGAKKDPYGPVQGRSSQRLDSVVPRHNKVPTA